MAEMLPIRRLTQRETPAEIPAAPRGLSPDSKRIWQEINAQWVIDAAARPLLHAGLECRDRYRAAAKQIKRDGPTVRVGNAMKTHPAHAILRDNLKEFRQIMRQLNLDVEAE